MEADQDGSRRPSGVIRTPDQRLRVFVSSTLGELASERGAVRGAVERLRLSPVMFELGARPHPPRELYRAYLAQSQVFLGIYWERYGWVAPGETISGLEDEYRLAGERPRLIYIKEPAADREPRLAELLADIQADDAVSYKRFKTPEELSELVENDLAVLLTERFEATGPPDGGDDGRPASPPPVPLTETLGREREAETIGAALQAGARFLTLTGPGGVGKTRLAVEVAGRIGPRYPQGAHFVPLAAISDPDLALHTIADRLGLRLEGTRGTLEALADRLRAGRRLLLLDNLEHVAGIAAELAALLERCPELQLLTTSRHALHVRGERNIPIAPLPIPSADAELGELRDQPAVRLFIDRATEVSPDFEPTTANLKAVVELCRRLDGLPLAIELAAARVRMLPPAVLLERLDERLDMLGGTAPDLPERQRTLRATLDWSYELLDEGERSLFASLGVFVGGFYLEAAEAVCALDRAPDGLERLASLLDKSLLVAIDDPSGRKPRFSMLETVRAYAHDRLEERGETGSVRRRHLDWYLRIGEEAKPFLCGAGQREWAAYFDPERANLRAAVETALDQGDDAAAIELVWDVIVFYFIRDAVDEPRAWLERAAAAGRGLDLVARAKLGSLLTLLRIHHGQYEGARTALESALRAFHDRGMHFEAAVTLKELAWVRYLLERDADAAVEALEEASRLFESIDHDWGVAIVETQLGTVLAANGDLEGAEAHHRRSLERSRSIDNEPLIAAALEHVAASRILAGEAGDALPLVEEATELVRRGRHLTEGASCLDAVAGVALAGEDARTAAVAITVAEAVRDRLGVTLWPTVQPFVSSQAAAARERIGDGEYEALAAQAPDRDPFETLAEALTAARSTVG
jgi:predicted ATPase